MNRTQQILDFLEFVEGQPRQSVRQLMGNILLKSRMMTDAEAGSIFIVRRHGRRQWLEPESLQNDRLKVGRNKFTVDVSPTSIAGYVAMTGEIVNIADVYKIPGDAPYSFSAENEIGDYRTRSMLCFPLKNYQDRVIGVAQLINRCPPGRNGPLPFRKDQARLVLPIARSLATHIERADMLETIRGKNRELRARNDMLAEQRRQVEALQVETEDAFMMSINLLARAAEIHDEETGNHIVRCNEYSRFLAEELGMDREFCDEIHYSAQLHDVGKMSVNTAVLKKEGRLTDDEKAEMDRHPTYGYQILVQSPRLQMAAEIALNHHEKWDGSGYPRGIRGEAIPLSARIVALADIYDALRSRRPYKPAFSHEQTCAIILEGDDRIDPSGHFDPGLLALFARRHEGLREIYRRLRDD